MSSLKITDHLGQSIEASLIHCWDRAGKPDVVSTGDSAPGFRAAALALFNASPSIERVALVCATRLFFFLVADANGEWWDVLGKPCRVTHKKEPAASIGI